MEETLKLSLASIKNCLITAFGSSEKQMFNWNAPVKAYLPQLSSHAFRKG